MNIYVGNLSYNTAENEIRQAFESFGQVNNVNIIKDKFSGESKGFGFVEMGSKEEAEANFKAANKELHKMVSKGILKKQTASRKVSRLALFVNKIQ